MHQAFSGVSGWRVGASTAVKATKRSGIPQWRCQ